ncbi:hypothetical protein BH11MYX1_BH11MYX1_28380 [soil metagenome]
MADPRRILDDDAANPRLRSLLGSAKRDDEPRAAQLVALAARLGPLLGPPLPPPLGAAATPAVVAGVTKAALAVKLGALAAVIGLAGGGAWLAFHGRASVEPSAPPSAAPIAPPIAPPVVTPAVVPLPSPAPLPTPKPAILVPPHVTRPAIDPAAEAALVTAAQQALVDHDPALALARTRDHAVRFPAGPHAEERDRIAIEALLGLGHTADARAAAARFFTRYPRSIYRTRVQALLP